MPTTRSKGRRTRCPACNKTIAKDAWLCPHCDHVLDGSALEQPDAMILGDVTVNADDFDVVAGAGAAADGKTGNFLFYASAATSRVVRPDAVPEVVPRKGRSKVPKTPYEDFILSCVDGKRSVKAILRKSGLAPQEVTVALLTLIDKGLIRVSDAASPARPPAKKRRNNVEQRGQGPMKRVVVDRSTRATRDEVSAADERAGTVPPIPASATVTEPKPARAKAKPKRVKPKATRSKATARKAAAKPEKAKSEPAKAKPKPAKAKPEPAMIAVEDGATEFSALPSSIPANDTTLLGDEPIPSMDASDSASPASDGPGSDAPGPKGVRARRGRTRAGLASELDEDAGSSPPAAKKTSKRRGRSRRRSRRSSTPSPSGADEFLPPSRMHETVPRPTPPPAAETAPGETPPPRIERSRQRPHSEPPVPLAGSRSEPLASAPSDLLPDADALLPLGEADQPPDDVETRRANDALSFEVDDTRDPAVEELFDDDRSEARSAPALRLPSDALIPRAESDAAVEDAVAAAMMELDEESSSANHGAPALELPDDDDDSSGLEMEDPLASLSAMRGDNHAAPDHPVRLLVGSPTASEVARRQEPAGLPPRLDTAFMRPIEAESPAPPATAKPPVGQRRAIRGAAQEVDRRKTKDAPANRSSDAAAPKRASKPASKPAASKPDSNPAPSKPPRAGPGVDGLRMAKAEKLFSEALKDKATGNLVSARMNMKLALTFNPGNPLYIEAFEELSLIAPTGSYVINMAKKNAALATKAEREGRIDDAVQLLEASLKDAEDPGVLNRLGVLLAMKKFEFRRAQRLIERAIELSPNNTTFGHNLAKVLQIAATDDVDKREAEAGSKRRGILGFLGRGDQG